MRTERKTLSNMDAGPDDPLIGVHVLAQFVFCPRAGVCAFESRQEWPDEEPAPAQLDFLPRYDIYEIERALSECVSTLTWLLAALLMTLSIGSYLAVRYVPEWIWSLVFVIPLFAMIMGPTIRKIWALRSRHRDFLSAEVQLPDPDSEDLQPVNWFSMLKAGFMSVSYHRLTHEKWKVEGKPWRVLRQGNLRIPVFFQSASDQRLHPKHLAKVAAYCHLLQAVETYESPYAIVLREDSVEGVAVPYNARARKIFHEALRLARDTLKCAEQNNGTTSPEQVSLCSGCPFGEPRRYKPGESDEVQTRLSLPLFVLADAAETIHHSYCGDRFRWMAPHKNAQDKGLEPVP